MRLGTFRLTRKQAARAIAGVVAAFLLTGQVLAAAGLCVIKVPADTSGSTAAGEVRTHEGTAEANPCGGHLADGHSQGSGTSRHHCPTDDPTQQSRNVDVPAAQVMAALPASLPDWSIAAARPQIQVVAVHPAEPRPLYARLQRLRL
jgi:hypothetical protein